MGVLCASPTSAAVRCVLCGVRARGGAGRLCGRLASLVKYYVYVYPFNVRVYVCESRAMTDSRRPIRGRPRSPVRGRSGTLRLRAGRPPRERD